VVGSQLGFETWPRTRSGAREGSFGFLRRHDETLRIPYRPGTLWECLCVSTCRGATVADMEWWLLAGGHDDSVWTVTLIVVLLRSYGFCVARSFSCPRTRIDLPFFLLVGDPILMNTRLVMARSCRRSAAL
jgi:hypothetical protein